MNKTFFSYKALESQRASGYKNTAYALAELIDNAFDAEAENVKVIFFEKRADGKKYVDEIIVCDDGDGMNKKALEYCLQFGGTENLDMAEVVRKKKRGKFGFGLPNASLSQCPNIHVYSKTKKDEWQTTYLNLLELKEDESIELPGVKTAKLPKFYIDAGGILDPKKGTIIAWRNCDRLSHSRASTIINKSEELLGRLYRYLLNAGKTISLQVFEHNSGNDTFIKTSEKMVRKNDPLFLMSDTYISERLYEEAHKQGEASDAKNSPAAHFKKFSVSKSKCKPTNLVLKDHTFTFCFNWKAKKYDFDITTSVAHLDIQKPGVEAGAKTAIGQFYGKKKSISFVRADREISSDTYGFYLETQPQHRWWTIEVKFNADADELLGVHNNKQGIEFLRTESHDESELFNVHTATLQQAREQLWIELTKKIKDAYDAAWRHVKGQDEVWKTKNAGNSGNNPEPGLPGATETTNSAVKKTDGERKGNFSPEVKKALQERLREKYPKFSAADIDAAVARYDESRNRAVILYHQQEGSKTLWSLTPVMGFLVILINTENAFYQNILLPLRGKGGTDAALSAIELFISSLAWEEYDRFWAKDAAKDILEQYRAYVGLHLDNYLKDNDIHISEEDVDQLTQQQES